MPMGIWRPAPSDFIKEHFPIGVPEFSESFDNRLSCLACPERKRSPAIFLVQSFSCHYDF